MNNQAIKQTYNEKIGELHLRLSEPNERKFVFIFVEGESDIRLFRQLFDGEKCKIEHIPGGNPKLEECVATLIGTHSLIIGIRDADFLHLNEEEGYSKQNMFLTDSHDIEMTMLSQNTILDAFVFEFTEILKSEDAIAFLTKIMKSFEMVSYLKWLNDKESLCLNFASTSFLNLISFESFDTNFSQYLMRVFSKSPNAIIKDEQLIREKITSLMELEPNLLQLTNGHDLLKVLAKYFKEKTKHTWLDNDKIIASTLRIAFTSTHFQATNLYQELENWSLENGVVIFHSSLN